MDKNWVCPTCDGDSTNREGDCNECREVNENDRDEIARLVKEGYTSGLLHNEEGYTINWSLSIDKFK